MNNPTPTFEESLHIIDKALELRRHKWTLAATPWIDYDDAAQIIRVHIWRKWHLYKPEMPLVNWVNTVISHKLTNLTKSIYGTSSRPCLKCAADEGLTSNGEGLCTIYGKQCNTCPFYAEWEKKQKPALNAKLPVTLENHQQEVFDIPNVEDSDFKDILNLINNNIKIILLPLELKVYTFLYVDGLTEEKTARKLSINSNDISNLKKSIILKIKTDLVNQREEFEL